MVWLGTVNNDVLINIKHIVTFNFLMIDEVWCTDTNGRDWKLLENVTNIQSAKKTIMEALEREEN